MSMENFRSALAPSIRALIQQKRSNGTKYTHGETVLGVFDRFCANIGYKGTYLTEELISRWKEHVKGKRGRQPSQYLTYVRHLGVYLHSIGIATYIPPMEQYSGTADPIELASPFASYIKAFVAHKRSNGYKYECAERFLYRFDRFCVDRDVSEPKLTSDLVAEWIAVSSANQVSCFQQFAKYLLSMGLDVHVIQKRPSKHHRQPYILTDDELSAFFAVVDSFSPDYRSYDRMAAGYSIMFRLYYCCGMRLQEVCQLKVEDVDLETGQITVRNGKGHKDRVLYMHSDLLQMCRHYDVLTRRSVKERSWLFPARNIEKPICKTNMSRRFDTFWSMTKFSDNSRHRPSVHSLRHTFVVNRINTWIKEGMDLSHMLPYLSRYLGHKTLDDTFYYYHLSAAATDIIHEKDHTSALVIPEVSRCEEV